MILDDDIVFVIMPLYATTSVDFSQPLIAKGFHPSIKNKLDAVQIILIFINTTVKTLLNQSLKSAF